MNPRTAGATRAVVRLATVGATCAVVVAGVPALAGTAAATPVAAVGSLVTAAPEAPRGLSAVRLAATPNDFLVSWQPVADVHHYNVSVFANGEDHVVVVPAGTTELTVPGVDYLTSYRITVGSRDAAGRGATSGPITLRQAVPGAPSGVTADRGATRDSLAVAWAAPLWGGYTPVSSYHVTVTRLSDSKVLLSADTTARTATVPGLDPARQYTVRLTARNVQGAGAVASLLVGNHIPAAPSSLVAVRNGVSTGTVDVSWKPSYAGYAPVLGYEVGYGLGSITTINRTTATSAKVAIPAARSGVVAVRSFNALGTSGWTRVITVPKVGDTATTSPVVSVTSAAGIVSVRTTQAVGSTAIYPRLVVRIFPTLGNGGFTDEQWSQNGAQLLTFATVPTGSYTVTVSGAGTAGETELARTFVNVGNDGLLADADWQIVFGRAGLTGGKVDMPNTGEHRVLTKKDRPSQDMVLNTYATLRSGQGYGVFFRSSADAQGKVSGLSLQYDVGYGNKFIIRHWNAGTECGTPIAQTPFPAGFAVNAEHKVIVVAKGDTVYATVDGDKVFEVASLSAAVAANKCGYPMPTGTRIGFRTWTSSSAVFAGTTLSN